MKNLMALALCFTITLCTVACNADHPDQSDDSSVKPGSDRDAHGCIGSAGYTWCQRTTSCERPWELAKKHGFENSPEAFVQFCQ